MLNQVFILDEVIMLGDRAAWQKQQPSKDPADEPESLSASLERTQSAGFPWLQRMSAAGARWAAVSSSVSL